MDTGHPTCWWFRNPKQPAGMYKTLVNDGSNYLSLNWLAGFPINSSILVLGSAKNFAQLPSSGGVFLYLTARVRRKTPSSQTWQWDWALDTWRREHPAGLGNGEMYTPPKMHGWNLKMPPMAKGSTSFSTHPFLGFQLLIFGSASGFPSLRMKYIILVVTGTGGVNTSIIYHVPPKPTFSDDFNGKFRWPKPLFFIISCYL